MTEEAAILYTALRMEDIGVGKNYYIRPKHFVLHAGETIELNADNQFFILVDEVSEVLIQSDFGLYDLADPTLNEQSYEHQGTIRIYNYAPNATHIKFIQAIPKN